MRRMLYCVVSFLHYFGTVHNYGYYTGKLNNIIKVPFFDKDVTWDKNYYMKNIREKINDDYANINKEEARLWKNRKI